jgi:membrane associated rhomboid family serine protease
MTIAPHLPPHRERHEPATFAPPALLALIAFMLGLHAYRELFLGLFEDADIALLKPTAYVSARFTLMVGLVSPQDVMADIAAADAQSRPLKRLLAQTFLPHGGAPWTLASYAFLHAGWEHVIFNSLWLLVFGSPVMIRFGLVRFALFFLVTAALAALFHTLFNPRDVHILVGASGAVSALTAAALRFAFIGGAYGRQDFHAPAPPVPAMLRDKRVVAFVLVWFGLNLLAGLGMPLGASGDPRIAWEAHVGGFLAGLALFPVFDPVRRPAGWDGRAY